MTNSPTVRAGFIYLFALALGACATQDQTELREWMSEQAKSMRGGVPPLPEIKPLEAVSYEGSNLVVPFSPQKIVTAEPVSKSIVGDIGRVRQPLENFPLEELTVQVIIVTGKRPYALVQPKPPNKPMHVNVGDYMGQNFGKVVSIDCESVKVLETIKDNNGVWTEREIVKVLPKQGETKCTNLGSN